MCFVWLLSLVSLVTQPSYMTLVEPAEQESSLQPEALDRSRHIADSRISPLLAITAASHRIATFALWIFFPFDAFFYLR